VFTKVFIVLLDLVVEVKQLTQIVNSNSQLSRVYICLH